MLCFFFFLCSLRGDENDNLTERVPCRVVSSGPTRIIQASQVSEIPKFVNRYVGIYFAIMINV